MAKCEKCGNEYLTRECLKCRDRKYSEKITKNNQNLTEKEKLFKTIRYAIIFFIGLLITGVIIDITISSYMLKKAEPSINNLNKMTTDMIKANKKLLEDLNKGFKTPNFNK